MPVYDIDIMSHINHIATGTSDTYNEGNYTTKTKNTSRDIERHVHGQKRLAQSTTRDVLLSNFNLYRLELKVYQLDI